MQITAIQELIGNTFSANKHRLQVLNSILVERADKLTMRVDL